MTLDNGQDRVGEATVRRFLDEEHDSVLAVGSFGRLFAAYLDHARRWEHEPDGFAEVLMRQGLGAAVLSLAHRPPDEFVGWTINIHRPPTNVFLTGDTKARTVTGRVFTKNVRPAESSRMFVQTTRAGRRVTQSSVALEGLDVLEMFEQYYERSVQTQARLFEIDDVTFVMLLALPDADRDWIEQLTREEAAEHVAGDQVRPLETLVFRFQCGCNQERMREIVQGLYESEREELFQGDPGVEVLCPRCGRRWWVEAKDVK
ncbi:MAG TPA: Hsp33 family molecular chaperone HslO [Candidatus Udaeobacter sp.]|nr:Hsp33 family molecular chaperone HslO [Candidatus Udaeobacter sp.]